MALLEQFAARKFPPNAGSHCRLEVRARGNDVTLTERRPYVLDRKHETDHPIARFTYEPAGRWRLFWLRNNGIWYEYENLPPSPDPAPLVRELEEDPTHIFWG